MLMTYVPHPSLKHFGIVTKSLIEKLEFLKDGEGDGEVIFFCYFHLFNFNSLALMEVVYLLSLSKCKSGWQ